jgi:16S rRNA (adenine1518-N6/adenine1519-N6)-dimethyltransferase
VHGLSFIMPKDPASKRGESLLERTRRLLRRSGIRARKGLGQHFLIDEQALQKIVEAADLSREDIVIEVGPGLGILTAELAWRAGWVIAIELDDRLAAVLRKTLPYDNVVIINQDVLGTDPASLLQGEAPPFPAGLRYKVVANLPYYITSPVLRHFLEASVKPEIMVVMVQKEVAEAIAAGPGRRSVLSIGVQFYGKPEIVARLPAGSFYPRPEVDSAVVRIDVHPRPPVEVEDTEDFFRLVRAGFAAARKQAANSLAQGLNLTKIEATALLEKSGIAPQRRAETFTLDEWAALYNAFRRRKDGGR